MAVIVSKRIVVPTPGKRASDYAVGDTVKLIESGAEVEYLVVHQGIPDDTLYDSSCDGTWALRKSIVSTNSWSSSNSNDYANSSINAYLNGEFYSKLSSGTQNAIKQVKVPYRPGNGYGTGVASGSNGFSTTCFLLSSTEVGFVHNYMPVNEGIELGYFSGCLDNGSDPRRIVTYNNVETNWWLRSPSCDAFYGTSGALFVTQDGGWNGSYCSNRHGIRPAFVLDSNALFDPGTNVIKG